MKILHVLVTRGRSRTWGAMVYLTKEDADMWRLDGLDVEEVLNTVPVWVVQWGLVRVWCWVQDLLNFKAPR